MWRIWLAALFWGLNFPAVKTLLDGMAPWTLRAAGLTAGGLLLMATTLAVGKSLAVPRAYWAPLVLAALLNVVGFNVFAVFAQLTMPASRAAMLIYTMPLWSVVFARLILGEAIDGLRWSALGLGAAGIVLLAQPFWLQAMAGDLPIGFVFVMGAAISWAAGTVYTKRARIPGDPLAITAWQIGLGAVGTTFGMVMFETPRLELWRPEIAATFAYHVIFPQAAAYVLWFGLMSRVPASTLALGTLLVPVFAVVGAVILLGERPTVTDIAGFALIFSAVVVDQGVRSWRERGTVN